MSEMRLLDQVAVVTGSGSGIGQAVAHLFAGEGAHIVLADINSTAVESLAEAIGGQAQAMAVDVTREVDVVAMVRQTISSFNRIDILINCAGISSSLKSEETSLDAWRSVLDINLTGTFLCCREVGRQMIRAGRGSIGNVASTSGLSASPYMAAYSAAKRGVVGLTKALAVEWGKHNVRVNCICPGATETPMLMGMSTKAYRADRIKRVPLGRLGQPSEQAQTMLFLASAESAYITGPSYVWTAGYSQCPPLPATAPWRESDPTTNWCDFHKGNSTFATMRDYLHTSSSDDCGSLHSASLSGARI